MKEMIFFSDTFYSDLRKFQRNLLDFWIKDDYFFEYNGLEMMGKKISEVEFVVEKRKSESNNKTLSLLKKE